MDKTCLIIDNEDQTGEIETIQRIGKSKRLNVNCYQFNVGSTNRPDLLTDGKIDIAKVIDAFNNEFRYIPFHLIAFDWNLSDDSITGVELIRKFNSQNIRKNTPRLLYSGILKEEIASMLHEFKAGTRPEIQLLNWLNTLIKVDIVDFVDRPEYANTVVSILEKTPESIEFAIEKELRKLSTLKFKSVFPDFKDMTFQEIADEIEKDPNKGSVFKNEIINQTISFLAQINKD